jgi:drug/metabolite transporter (DMT)-like permease
MSSILTLSHVLQLIGYALLLSLGQFLFKMAAMRAQTITDFHSIALLALNPFAIAAMALYGVAAVAWVTLLQKVPLALAYPFVAVGFITIPLFSWLIFNEPLTLRYCFGVGLILVGLFFIVRP